MIYTAHSRAKTIRAVVRLWVDVSLSAESDKLWQATRAAGSIGVLAFHLGAEPTPSVRERIFRVFRQCPGWLWRIEEGVTGGESYVTVINHNRGWVKPPRGQFSVFDIAPGVGVEGTITGLFDPVQLLPTVTFQDAQGVTIRGRRALSIRATPRLDVDLLIRDWPYGDEYRLLVDEKYGILLSFSAILGKREFMKNEVLEVAFDEPLESELFLGPPDAPKL